VGGDMGGGGAAVDLVGGGHGCFGGCCFWCDCLDGDGRCAVSVLLVLAMMDYILLSWPCPTA
jgi:hypothetical protein